MDEAKKHKSSFFKLSLERVIFCLGFVCDLCDDMVIVPKYNVVMQILGVLLYVLQCFEV